MAAIVAAGFIWGFGHATYPNQPFYIRGVEVGCAGVLIGFLMMRFGILPLLIWHYTVDALYTAMLLLRSGNNYYVVSGGLASLVFAIPMLVSIALYVRNKGFVPDDDLSNETLPIKPVPERAAGAANGRRSRSRRCRSRAASCSPASCSSRSPPARSRANLPSIDDAVDYRITKEDAKRIAATRRSAARRRDAHHRHAGRRLPLLGPRLARAKTAAARAASTRIAVDYLLRHGMSMHVARST